MASPQIHAGKFEQMIARRGRDVKWEQAVICSCWNMNTQQPSYECNACNGSGYTYDDPLIQRALVMSIANNKEFEEMSGIFEVGDAVMTVPYRIPRMLPNGTIDVTESRWEINPMFDVGMYDKVTLLDDEYKTSELLIRGESIFGRPPDTLLNDDVVEIKTVRTSDPITGAITKYRKDRDFRIVGNRIEWIPGGSAPDEGQTYSVMYTHRPVYVVLTNLPKPRKQDNQDLPRYVALRYRAGGFDRK